MLLFVLILQLLLRLVIASKVRSSISRARTSKTKETRVRYLQVQNNLSTSTCLDERRRLFPPHCPRPSSSRYISFSQRCVLLIAPLFSATASAGTPALSSSVYPPVDQSLSACCPIAFRSPHSPYREQLAARRRPFLTRVLSTCRIFSCQSCISTGFQGQKEVLVTHYISASRSLFAPPRYRTSPRKIISSRVASGTL